MIRRTLSSKGRWIRPNYDTYTLAPIRDKINQCHFGDLRVIFRGTQYMYWLMYWLSGRGKKTTSAMARWHWLEWRPCTYFSPLFSYFLTCCVAASCDINPFSMIKSFLYNIMSVRTVLLFFGIGLNRNQKNWQFSCQIGSYPNWKLYLGFTATHGSIFGEKNMKIWQLLWWKLDRRIKYVLSKNTFVQFWF